MSTQTSNSSWWCQQPTRTAPSYNMVGRRAKIASGVALLAISQGVVLSEVLRENDKQTRCVLGRKLC